MAQRYWSDTYRTPAIRHVSASPAGLPFIHVCCWTKQTGNITINTFSGKIKSVAESFVRFPALSFMLPFMQ